MILLILALIIVQPKGVFYENETTRYVYESIINDNKYWEIEFQVAYKKGNIWERHHNQMQRSEGPTWPVMGFKLDGMCFAVELEDKQKTWVEPLHVMSKKCE